MTQPGVDVQESCKDNKTLFAVPVDLLKRLVQLTSSGLKELFILRTIEKIICIIIIQLIFQLLHAIYV